MDPELLSSIRRIRENIQTFQSAILHQDVKLSPRAGVQLWQRYLPLRRVGICVPGGAAAYPSTVLMTVVPAQVAGVKEIAVIAPPTPFGAYNQVMLATCHELGVKRGLPGRWCTGDCSACVWLRCDSSSRQDRRPRQSVRRAGQEVCVWNRRYRFVRGTQ